MASDYRPATLAVRAGQVRTHEGEHAEAIFTTSSFVFANAAEAASKFADGATGNIYSRFTNPTVRCFEERLAALEGAESCVATASGMAAVLSLCMTLLKAGDHLICSDSVFGSTITLLNRYIVKFGVEVTYVRPDATQEWARAVKPNTRLMFLETPTNPMAAIADIGIGLPYLVAKAMGVGAGDVVAITYEYGNTFVIAAGLLNMLVVLDVFDIDKGRK